MRLVTWNCRRAGPESALWDYLDELSPDVVTLQEVSGLPHRMLESYERRLAHPLRKSGTPQTFVSGILVRGRIVRPVELLSGTDWIDAELSRYSGNLPAYEIEVGGQAINLVNVYSPAWPLDSAHRYGVDVESVKLRLNRRLWLADLLVSALRHTMPTMPGPWIVAGDFNLSETFDTLWKGGPRGNREYLDRMTALGLTDALRYSQGELTSTFRSPRGGSVLHQIDHLFVSQGMLLALKGCAAGSHERVFEGKLSDHLPVIADFGL